MKRFRWVLIIIGVMALSGIASAEEGKPLGVYVGGHIGMSILNFSDRKFDDVGTGMNWSPSSDTDTVFGGGLAIGYDLDPQLGVPVRLEVNYTARSRGDAKSSSDIFEEASGKTFGTTKKDKISLQTLMLNAWVDIPTGTALTPYLGGGIGFGFIDYKASLNFVDKTDGTDDGFESGSTNKTNFAWSLGAGVAYDITANWTVDLGYRYIDAGKASKSFRDDDGVWAKSKADVQVHDVMLGVRYTF